MTKLFPIPISTSNLHAPNVDSVWQILASSFDEKGKIVTGQLTRELEERLAAYHESKYCVTFSTGFWGLVAAVQLKSIPNRSEVIIPSLTYRRLSDVVFWSGHTPVFADIETKNLSLCPLSVEKLVSSETALILAVHPIVNCCQVDRLIELSNRVEVPIVFDAVESVHETYDGKRIGSFGVGEVFSLHASKLLNGAEGGYVCTDDSTFRDALVEFRQPRRFGVCMRDEGTEVAVPTKSGSSKESQSRGINGVLNDVHAAMAIADLEEIEQIVAHNRRVYEVYCDLFPKLDGIEILKFDETEQTSFKNIVAKVTPPFPLCRDSLVDYLNREGILARSYYSPPLHKKAYQYAVKRGDLGSSEQAMSQYINFPCGSRVAPDDVKMIFKCLQKLLTHGF